MLHSDTTDFFEVYESSLDELKRKPVITRQNAIIRCKSGQAKLNIDNTLYNLKKSDSFILMDSTFFHIEQSSDDFRVEVCTFTHSILHDIFTIISNKVIDLVQYMTPERCSIEELQIVDPILDQIIRLYHNKDHAYRRALIISYASSYILEMYEIVRHKIAQTGATQSNTSSYIINRFYDLINRYHLESRKIEFYADKLNITPRYLHKVTTHAMKLTPKQLMDLYITSLAKRMLLTTFLSNQEIANSLNFSDQSSFGQFFKRNAGISPTEFRRKYK